jgi:hypothetical protein
MMKIEKVPQEPAFRPVEIKITIESEADLAWLWAACNAVTPPGAYPDDRRYDGKKEKPIGVWQQVNAIAKSLGFNWSLQPLSPPSPC